MAHMRGLAQVGRTKYRLRRIAANMRWASGVGGHRGAATTTTTDTEHGVLCSERIEFGQIGRLLDACEAQRTRVYLNHPRITDREVR